MKHCNFILLTSNRLYLKRGFAHRYLYGWCLTVIIERYVITILCMAEGYKFIFGLGNCNRCTDRTIDHIV